jgi:hypothetical protein
VVAVLLRRQHAVEAAVGQLQVLLQQRQHRAQIGRLRQPVPPAPLQGLEHGGADAGVEGELAQADATALAGLAQLLAG